MITGRQIRAVLGAGGQVVDSAGHGVGSLVEVVLDPHSYEPAWVTVACTDGPVVVVPLAGARRLDGCLQLACTAADVTGAPGVNGSAGRLTPLLAEELSA